MALGKDVRDSIVRMEEQLRRASEAADLATAKVVAAELQKVLRGHGQVTRLMRAKNWLFEAAMGAGELSWAMQGLMGVRAKVERTTRVYVEATSLLAVCHLRRKEIALAEPLIVESLQRLGNIKSGSRRLQLRHRLIVRFEEEMVLAAMTGNDVMQLDPAEIEKRAGDLLQSKTEDEMIAEVGRAVPPAVIKLLLHVHELAQLQLTSQEVKLLPAARDVVKDISVGGKVMSALKRSVWRSLCDPDSEVYKIWFERGMNGLLSQKALATAVASACAGLRVGYYALAATLAALVLKTGLNAYCELTRPEGIMIHTTAKPKSTA